jgi:Capsule assembly protein Wzi
MVLSRGIGIVSRFFRTAAGLLCLLAFSALAEQPDFKALPSAHTIPTGSGAQATPPATAPASACEPATLGSPFVTLDSWIYPAIFRLYGLGFVDHVFLNMRPWPRSSINRMLEDIAARLEDANPGPETDQAEEIYEALSHELRFDMAGPCMTHEGNSRIESVYTLVRPISGTPLHDSFHLGSSIINDYGRPFENGFNNYTGASGYASAGRFTLYVRGEFQYAPSATGYSPALAQTLALNDGTAYTDPVTHQVVYYPQANIPAGPINSITRGRFLEDYVSANVLNHEISFGKQDDWMGPALGGGFAYSNNAPNIYAFHINRVEPLRIPGLSYLTGPFRYEFFIGGLQGHTYVPNPAYPPPPGQPSVPNVISPGNPWVHVEKISFRPTENLEFGFQRSVIWGGEGHGPITLHTFLKSFFSVSSPSQATKNGRDDPGARFGSFDFSYRLPFLRRWLTLYTDGEVHDDVSPIDAPRRAAWLPGLYLSHIPGVPRVDVRAEGVYTDPPVSRSQGGYFMYWEAIQNQGYTNNGQLFGDWVGREGKGGQAWITYHLSGNEWLQINARHQKAAKDFIFAGTTEYGTTLNDIGLQIVKRVGRDFEINGSFTYERYKAPIYLPGEQTVTVTNIQLTWFPSRKISF